MVNTDRYTWRHNYIVNFIVNNVDSKYQVYSDFPGWEAQGGGSIPPALCVTNLKQDIVMLVELTAPFDLSFGYATTKT